MSVLALALTSIPASAMVTRVLDLRNRSRGVDALHPPLDAGSWFRILAGAALLLAVPGLLVTRRWANRADPLAALSLALPAGILLVAVVSYALVPVGAVLHWWLVLPLAAAIALAVRRGPRHPQPDAVGPRWPTVVACGLMAGVVVAGLAGYDAPRGDAANHAFMVRRLAAVHSVAQDDVFAAPVGSPGFVYLVGWHAAAALIGGEPHLAAWVLPLICLALLPIALIALWQRCGVPPAAAVWGAVFVAANRGFPAGALQWGALGHAVGWLCVPVTTLAVLAALIDGGRRRGLLAGLLLVGLLLVHAVELPVVALMTLCGWLAHRRAQPGARPDATGGLLALGLPVAAAAAAIAAIGLDYGAPAHVVVTDPWRELGRAVDAANRAGRQWAPIRVLVVAGVWLAWRRPALRPLAVASVMASVLYMTLASLRDPVSSALAAPFYREPARVLMLQMFLLPPLLGVAMQAMLDGTGRRRRALRLAGWLLAAALVVPGLIDNGRHIRAHAHEEPWGKQEYAMARALAGVVQDGEVVANLPQDGSVWAWHASGERFLLPATWPLALPGEAPRRQRVLGFLQDAWPSETLSLRDEGVRYLYVGDRWDPRYGGELTTIGWGRARFDGDPRFTLVLREGEASLYRIEWGGRRVDLPGRDDR